MVLTKNEVVIDFARTRTPWSIDQTEQSTNYRSPYVEDCEDTELEPYNSPPRRISPFGAGIMSANTRSPAFVKRKAAQPRLPTSVVLDLAELEVVSEERPASFKREQVAPDNAPNSSPSEPAICQGKLIDLDAVGEPPKDMQRNTENIDTNGYLTSARLVETKDITDSASQPGMLTILDEEIDQQLTGEGLVLLEPQSTGSSSFTISIPDFYEAPNSSWILGPYKSSRESFHNSVATETDNPLRSPLSNTDQTQASETQRGDNTKEGLAKEDSPETFHSQVTADATVVHDQDNESTKDVAELVESPSADDCTPPQEQADERFPENPTSKKPTISPGHASTGGTPHTSFVSPSDSKKIMFQPSIPQPVFLQATVPADWNEDPPTRTGSHYQRPYVTDDSPSAESSEAGEGYEPLFVECYKSGFHLNLKTPESSVASSPSGVYRKKDLSQILSEVEEDTPSLVVPDQQLVQTQMVINQALQEFKVDFLQQIESIIQQSTKPARNSAAATMLARPSPPQMDTLVGVSISNAQDEITNRIESSKAESMGLTLRIAEATKEHSAALTDDLRKIVIEHVDHRLEALEKMLVELKPDIQQSSTQNEAHLKAIITGLLPPESLTTLEKLPELIEQIKTLATTNTKEVSKKLEQYAATANTVSSFCTRLDETITSKQALQNEMISNLYNILNQSTLQNNAINDLSTIVTPLATLIKGISYDTNLIDAKLAKNADTFNSITKQTEKLEQAATKFGKVVGDAECKFGTLTSKIDQIAKIGPVVEGTQVVERFEALQGQMVMMQEQMDRIAAAMARQSSVETRTADISAPANQHTVVVPVTTGVSPSPPQSPIEYTSTPSSPTSDIAPPRINSNDHSEPTLTITISAKLTNRAVINLPCTATTIPFSQCTTVPTILSILRSLWTKQLLSRGVHAARLQLIAIWISSTDAPGNRVVDNDLAYRGWYKAVTSVGTRAIGILLNFEFLECGGEDEAEEVEEAREPMSKKRKQEVLMKGDGEGVEFRLDVWRSARQTRFGRWLESGYGLLDYAGRGMAERMMGREVEEEGEGGRDGY